MKLFVLAMPLVAMTMMLSGKVVPNKTEVETEPAPYFEAYFNSARLQAKRQQYNGNQSVRLTGYSQRSASAKREYQF